jgi:RTX calcium-binding nonapeptide repeat (4 copies)
VITGGADGDVLDGNFGRDVLRGDDGDDFIISAGDETVDTVKGGSGTDQGCLGDEDVAVGIEQTVIC